VCSIRMQNGVIVGSNRSGGVHTPFLNKGTLMSNHRVSVAKLADGLHPSPQLAFQWERELRHNVALNRARLHAEA